MPLPNFIKRYAELAALEDRSLVLAQLENRINQSELNWQVKALEPSLWSKIPFSLVYRHIDQPLPGNMQLPDRWVVKATLHINTAPLSRALRKPEIQTHAQRFISNALTDSKLTDNQTQLKYTPPQFNLIGRDIRLLEAVINHDFAPKGEPGIREAILDIHYPKGVWDTVDRGLDWFARRYLGW